MTYIKDPVGIESRSFEIIDEIIQEMNPGFQFENALEEAIYKRCIHTSADFDYLSNLKFVNGFQEKVVKALQGGSKIYTDTKMALSGINKKHLEKLGCSIYCLVDDEEVVQLAKEKGITRSMAAVDKACAIPGDKIFVFGNAPTALFRLLEKPWKECGVQAVVGVPVGFVGASESKDALYHSDLPGVCALGRKGGSNIAAAIINAVLYQLIQR